MTMTRPTEESMVTELEKHFKDIPVQDQILFKNSLESDQTIIIQYARKSVNGLIFGAIHGNNN